MRKGLLVLTIIALAVSMVGLDGEGWSRLNPLSLVRLSPALPHTGRMGRGP